MSESGDGSFRNLRRPDVGLLVGFQPKSLRPSRKEIGQSEAPQPYFCGALAVSLGYSPKKATVVTTKMVRVTSRTFCLLISGSDSHVSNLLATAGRSQPSPEIRKQAHTGARAPAATTATPS